MIIVAATLLAAILGVMVAPFWLVWRLVRLLAVTKRHNKTHAS